MKRLRRAVPVLVVSLVIIGLGYPIALLFGLPYARQHMANLSNWTKVTVHASPVAELPSPAAAAAGSPDASTTPGSTREVLASGTVLRFEHVPDAGLLVRDEVPLPLRFRSDGDAVTLASALTEPLLRWGDALSGPLDAPSGKGYVFGVPVAGDLDLPLYLGTELLRPASTETVERADGQRTTFHFPEAGDGPVLVGTALMREGSDVTTTGRAVSFAVPPPFNASVRRVSGGYAVLDADAGTIALAQPSEVAPRTATHVLRIAERLEGATDGSNVTFHLQHAPLVETDRARRIFLGDHELTAEPERPEERVDGLRASFTFAGDTGIVTVAGVPVFEGRDYQRTGNVVTFVAPPARNAALRQYRDYFVNDPASGSVMLAVPPPADADLWALSYTYYGQPSCGSTAMECFLTMSQHPVPFPHWIAERIVPFFSSYPITDGRNIVRAVLYTALGTLWALLLGGAIGVLLAVVFVSFKPLESALLPWVIASQTVPIIALVPVLLLILGNAGITVQTSLVPTALIGAYIAFFPVTVGTVTGLRSVDPLALDLMKSYAASKTQVFLKVRFPAAVPLLFTSLKLGAAAALVGALVAETESNNSRGLGYAIIGQVQAGNVADVWLLLLVSAVLGIGLVALVGIVQRVAAPWERA